MRCKKMMKKEEKRTAAECASQFMSQLGAAGAEAGRGHGQEKEKEKERS